MKFDWNVMITLFGIVQGCFLLSLMELKKIAKNHVQFVLWLAVLLLLLLETFLIQSGIIKHALFLFKMTVPCILLLGPLLYGYTIAPHRKIEHLKKNWFHFIPFFFYLAYSFNFFLQPNALKYNIIVNDFHKNWLPLLAVDSFSMDPWNINGWIVVELMVVHLLIYSVAGWVKVWNDKKQDSREKRNWLLYLNTVLFVSALILFFAEGGVVNGHVFLESPFPRYAPSLFVACTVYLISFYLMLKLDVLGGASKKYLRSSLTKNYKQQKLKVLKDLIEAERLYLNHTFSLKVLAEKSGLSVHHISQILNEELRYNFFQLTNEYRIKEAKRRLRNDKGYIKIEHLAYELGYKSKSTFYNAFKKATQLTPTQFRNGVS